MMWTSLGVFNLAVLIYKVFSITEFFLVAAGRARVREDRALLILGTWEGAFVCLL